MAIDYLAKKTKKAKNDVPPHRVWGFPYGIKKPHHKTMRLSEQGDAYMYLAALPFRISWRSCSNSSAELMASNRIRTPKS